MSLVFLESFDAGWEDQQLYGGPNNYTFVDATTAGAVTGTYAGWSNGLAAFPQMNEVVWGFTCDYTPDQSTGTWRSDGNTIGQAVVEFNSDGSISWFRAGTATAIVQSPPGSYIPGNQHYFEFKFRIHDTLGYVEMRVDGATVGNFTGLDTRNGGNGLVDALTLFYRFDDMYVINNDGVGLTDFLGPIRVETIRPNGNGFYNQLVGSDGNSVDNYLQVDAGDRLNNVAAESDYNGSAVDGEKDSYAMEALPAYVATVLAVEARALSSKSDVGAKSGRILARRGGVDAVGSDQALSTDPAFIRWLMEEDPTDSTAWTKAKVDAMEFGLEVRP